MKKILAVSAAFLIFSASLIPAFAGGAGWHASQARQRMKARALQQQRTDEWKKFQSEMDAYKKGSAQSRPKTVGKSGRDSAP